MAQNTDGILSLQKVTAGYRGSMVLKDLTLRAAHGGITGIIGPNGAGKSTVLKVLLGYLRPVSGSVTLDGRDVTRLPPEQRIAAGIAYVAQTKSYFASQTIDENLLVGAYLVRDRRVIQARRDSVYDRFPILGKRRTQLAGALSGGEARMLEFGRMLMTAPRIAVLDEPSIGLSPKVIDQVYDEVSRLKAEGIAFLIVEQNVRKLLAIADFVYALDDGRNRFDGTPQALSSRDLLAELYFGRGGTGQATGAVAMSDVGYFVILGVMTGSLYGLLGFGMNVIFGVLRFINISHGDMLTVGAYVGVALALAGIGSPWVSMAAGVGVVAILGLLIARVLLSPITVEGRVHEQRGMVVTLGLSLVIPNAVLMVFGPDYQRVPGQFMTGVVEIGDLLIEKQRLAVLLGSVIIAAALMLFLRFTRLGRAIRAVGENPEAAQASGISVKRIHLLTFTLGAALAGAAGALVTPVTYAFPAMGINYTLYSIAVVIIGGLGSIWGALAAGIVLGVAESLSVIWIPSGYNALVAPLLMLLTLILRPQGLLGKSIVRA